jgi:hypothetical protein
MGDVRLGQGRDNAKAYFRDHPDVAEELDQQIRANAYKLMSRQSLAAAQAAGRAPAPESAPPAPAEEASKKGKAKENPVAAPAPRDMDELDALLNLDISAEDFEG